MLAIVMQPAVNAGKCDVLKQRILINAFSVFASLRVYALWNRSKVLSTIVGLLSIMPIGMHVVSVSIPDLCHESESSVSM